MLRSLLSRPASALLAAAAKRRGLASLPSHKVMPMPSLSPTMEVGSIAKWSVKEGDKFEAGAVLAEVETDKATVSLDATDDGWVARILVDKGEIKVGDPIMITVDEQADIAAFKDYAPPASAAKVAPPTTPPPPPPAPVAAPAAAPKPAAPTPAAKVVAPSPPTNTTTTSATTIPLSGVASVRWSGATHKGALSAKLAMDQQKYSKQWGFTGFSFDKSALPKPAKK